LEISFFFLTFTFFKGAVMLYKSILNVVGVVAVVVAVMFTGCVDNGVDPNDPNNPNNNGGGGNYTYTGPTVTIGGKVWMAENLNRATANSKCYDNDPSNCETYGRLYTWADARSACPSGWHLPTDAEWTALTDAVGGESTAGGKLKSTSGWILGGNGTDDYGFSALPGGRDNVGRGFSGVGYNDYWWSATEESPGSLVAWSRSMHYNREYVSRDIDGKTYLFSVRCVQD
jgi:uncharacterized protein (TIGR02145 family)